MNKILVCLLVFGNISAQAADRGRLEEVRSLLWERYELYAPHRITSTVSLMDCDSQSASMFLSDEKTFLGSSRIVPGIAVVLKKLNSPGRIMKAKVALEDLMREFPDINFCPIESEPAGLY